MRRMNLMLGLLTVALVSVGLYGCGGGSTSDSGGNQSSDNAGDGNGHEGHDDHTGHSDHADNGDGDEGKSDMDKMKEELAKLSEEDRESANKQHFCPVSDKMLGTMGAPIKVDVNGQDVWICCAGCKDTVLDDPDKYLAKLKK